ncbi:MAG: hypothetical protein AB7N91_31735 [Candidatus Tectimicrobiota bacterium]
MIGEVILLVVAMAYSGAVTAIGRRLPRPASVTAYITALAILVAVPLLPDHAAQRVDRVLSVVGAGRLLVHLAFMTVLSGLFLTIVLATHRWAWRQQLAVGGAGLLTILFVVLWGHVQTLYLPDLAALVYGIRAGHPPPVLWMNVVMGAGIVSIAVCGLSEFHHFLRGASSAYERGIAGVAIVLYVLTGVAGTLTMVEATARSRGIDMTVMHQVKTPFTASVLTLTAGLLVGQIWLWPLWRQRRQLLLRYLEPERVQLRNDLLNLSATEAEPHLDMSQEAYANHAIVEDVAARCRAAGISPARVALARMAASLLTLHRDNVMQDPGYGVATSWEELTAEAAAEIDQTMAATAWERALRESYISQQVYILMFLVLESRSYRQILLVQERPQLQAWHQQLADLIATVMHEHGHATPRYDTLARRAAPRGPLARLRARLGARWGGTVS